MTKLESRQQAYKRITDGLRNFLNHSVGAMTLVQEAKRTEIWKEKWSSWGEYCEKEFGKSRRRAEQLLEIAGTIEEIQNAKPFRIESEENKEILSNLNTRQVKALSGLPTEKKAEILAKAIVVQGGKSPRPGTINGVRMAMSEKEPEIHLDKTGYPIPEKLLPEWNRATEQAMGWIHAFDTIHRQVTALFGKDFAVAKINQSSLVSDHSNYRQQLKQAVPYAVCHNCQGKNFERCKSCNPSPDEPKSIGLGWVNRRFWDDCVPEEFKRTREKAYGTK